MTQDLLPITRIPRSGLPPRAVVVGDPARAAAVAALLDGAEEVSYHREYRVFSGSWKGVPVVVASHGVGGPGAILLFQELADAGVRTFLRFGTAGAMRPGIGDGDLVIAEAAVRDDGVTQQLLPPEYPAVSAPEAVLALQRAAREVGAPHHRGIVWTRAAFQPGLIPLDAYDRAGLVAIEMELSALYVTASLRGLVAGGVLVVDGANADELVDEESPFSTGGYNPHREVVALGVERGAVVSLEALRLLAEEYGFAGTGFETDGFEGDAA
ncbi:nucleoside phosphorylase [Streptomyces sp. NPDC057474]|uniref:nucleoside phosphorylase n=1 Tax=Streptomyces sp. NPDC057474 TaxID=3346144 RepID=UPI0036861E83